MATEKDARKSRRRVITSMSAAAAACIFVSIYSYFITPQNLTASLIFLAISTIFIKMSHDAYITPVEYILQYLNIVDASNKEIETKRNEHGLKKHHYLWRKIE